MPRPKTPRRRQSPRSKRQRIPEPAAEAKASGVEVLKAPPAADSEPGAPVLELPSGAENAAAARLRPSGVPDATYRLQFSADFAFQQAAETADYLRELGISDVYASPLFEAGPHSSHGYDICRFDQFSPKLGTAAHFEMLSDRLHGLGLGLLLDMVPNHMGADLSNGWWLDVLEKGQASRYAAWFDIDWQPLKSELKDKVLLPVLEDHYGKVLEAGKIEVRLENGAFWVCYYDRRFPVAPESYLELIQSILGSGESDSEGFGELRALFGPGAELELDRVKQQLGGLYQASAAFRECLEIALRRLNGTRGEERSFDALDRLLRRQHYRLAHWRVGREEINYRRFFDVMELVSLRMELPEVFESSHCLVARLLSQGRITGLRIDHPDGLWNPKQYFERLQRLSATRSPNGLLPSQNSPEPGAAVIEQSVSGSGDEKRPENSPPPLYIVAEKILTDDESLPPDWPVAGTTGYDFLNRVNLVFVDRAGRVAFDVLYREFLGVRMEFPTVVYEAKMRVLQESLISEHNALAQRLKSIAAASRMGQDLSFRQLHSALAEIVACFPVYRTYITEETQRPAGAERDHILQAVQTAKARNPDLDPDAFDFIQQILLLEWPAQRNSALLERCRTWVMKFQQLTGPVIAKGLEDTVFYNFNRLLSLNEVGGDPSAFGAPLSAFHEYNRRQSESRPHSLLATSTHDTKRGEDLRARLNVLSEVPTEWRDAISRWSEINAGRKSVVDAVAAPHPNDEYLFYQTLLGAWQPEAGTPDGLNELRARLVNYVLKAIKEAKARTSWTKPNSAYEEATRHFIESALTDGPENTFLNDFKPFQRKIGFFGVFNSLSQLLLKLTCPGVPDFYQGSELWDFNLVDPDNRRPVDYGLRRQLLGEIARGTEANAADLRPWLGELLRQPENGRVKLYLIWQTLRWRRAHRALYESGGYAPLEARGPKRQHVCAFARFLDREQAVTVVPRLLVGLANGTEHPPLGSDLWDTTTLAFPDDKPGDEYRNILTGERVKIADTGLPVAEVLSTFPVAVLERVSG